MVFSTTSSSSSNTFTPTYYSSVHDRITSLCKTILSSSSFKKINKRLPGISKGKQQSENLKWQQDSFHRILNLIGLRNEGIIQEKEVSVFRSQLLETLIASPADQEEPTIIRDKLLFLQELFYAKCISEDEYHSSKRPLLQRLAVQGAEIEARDVIVAAAATTTTLPRTTEKKLLEADQVEEEEEWTDIDFKDEEECLIMMGKENMGGNNKISGRSPMKRIKGGMIKLVRPSNYNYNTSDENKEEKNYGSLKEEKEEENPFWDKENRIEPPVQKKKKKKKNKNQGDLMLASKNGSWGSEWGSRNVSLDPCQPVSNNISDGMNQTATPLEF